MHSSPQELLSREEELNQAALKQKSQEEFLRQREHELAQWELEVFERELSLLIQQMNHDRPHVKKRKGTFKRNKLRGRDSERISMPLGRKAGWGSRWGLLFLEVHWMLGVCVHFFCQSIWSGLQWSWSSLLGDSGK